MVTLRADRYLPHLEAGLQERRLFRAFKPVMRNLHRYWLSNGSIALQDPKVH